jgi:predicted amino acid dehydrogenase
MTSEADGETTWLGPISFQQWCHSRRSRSLPPKLDVVLITHPRGYDDLPRLFPWSDRLSYEDRIAFTKCLKPIVGEVIETETLTAGLIFLPIYAMEIMNPATRGACRTFLQEDGLASASQTGARVVCLGGLTGSLTRYGKTIEKYAAEMGIQVTTGHSVTAISMLETFLKAIAELNRPIDSGKMTVVGLGSVGAAFVQLLLTRPNVPSSLAFVDTPSRMVHVENFANSIAGRIPITCESTGNDGRLASNSSCYDCDFLITAVSTPDVVDVSLVASGTILIDDSQPNCWNRDEAWKRCNERRDIAPCEAGLVDCSSINYRSRFPFDFADVDAMGYSGTSWCCLAEGLLKYIHPELPPTIGEPSREHLSAYTTAYLQSNFKTATLQCGPNRLPIEILQKTIGHPY